MFFLVDPGVLSLKVLNVSYCHCHASGMERLTEGNPTLTTSQAKTLYEYRIHNDVESELLTDIPTMSLWGCC